MFLSPCASAGKDERIVPPALEPGDTIAILDTARILPMREEEFKNEHIPRAIAYLRGRGFNVVVRDESFYKPTELELGEDTEELRAKLFNDAVKDPLAKMIWLFWGGHGTMHVLDQIDCEAFKANPKIVVGMGDHDVLLNALSEKTGVVTFNGPLIGSSLEHDAGFDNLLDMVTNSREKTVLRNLDGSPFVAHSVGECTAPLIGGNLCMMQSLIGTSYEPRYTGRILYIEDEGEHSYRLDRMLWHLKESGKLNGLAGIIIGNITPGKGETEKHALDVCLNGLKGLGIQIVYGVRAGCRVKDPITLPIGAVLGIKNSEITIMMPVVRKVASSPLSLPSSECSASSIIPRVSSSMVPHAES